MLLWLQKNAERDWSTEEVSRELRIDPDWATNQLADLHARGLLVRRGDSLYVTAQNLIEL